MPHRYKNDSVLFPIRIWTMVSVESEKTKGFSSPIFRIELPSNILTTPTEWLFDNKISHISLWKLQHTLFVFNPFTTFPPLVKGAIIINLKHSDNEPYNTIDVKNGAYIETNIDQFIVMSYPIPNTLPIQILSVLDMYNNKIFQMDLKPDVNVENISNIIENYAHYYTRIHMYPFIKEYFGWKSTNEYLCVPCSDNEKKYNTLNECQRKTYKHIKNRHTWVENSNDPLYNYMKWWNNQSSETQINSLFN